MGSPLQPQAQNGLSYVENNPVNFADPSGHIREQPWEVQEAREILTRLQRYQVRVRQDWGYQYVPDSNSKWIPTGCSLRWVEGYWSIEELATLAAGVTNLSTAMG
jgi:hypothetical protein